jgi:hypothetical protein
VPLRLERHLLDQPAVSLLDIRAVAERAPRGRDALGELVAQLLQLREPEQARSAATRAGGHRDDALARPGGAEELPKLRLEAADLVV